MGNIYSWTNIHSYGSASKLQLDLSYSKNRSGSTQQYYISGTVRAIVPSGGSTYYSNPLDISISISGNGGGAGSASWSGRIQSGSSNWSLGFETGWKNITNKISGVSKLSISIVDPYGGSYCNWSASNIDLAIDPAASSISSTSDGSTNNAPTVNITKYNSSFTDTITLSYNNQSISFSNFTSGQLPLTSAQKITIFSAQGAGTTATWSISGTTYSGSSSVGSYSSTVKITTEALSTMSASDYNVEGTSPTYSTTKNINDSNYKAKVIAYVGSYGGTAIYTSNNFTTAQTNVSAAVNAATIYNSNTTSKNGTIYWRIYTYINTTEIGHVDNCTSKYYFQGATCGPTLSTLQYKFTDAGTGALMGVTLNTNYNYNSNTSTDKLIASKTVLALTFTGAIASGKGTNLAIKRYEIEAPSITKIIVNSTSGSPSTQTLPALTSSGTIKVTIFDTREFSSELHFNVTVNEYYDPVVSSIAVVRQAKSQTDVTRDKKVRLTATISIPSYVATYLKNNSSYYIKYKYTSDGTTWTTGSDIKSQFTVSGNTLVATDQLINAAVFEQTTQYQFKLDIKSYYVTSTESDSVVIPISAPVLSRRPNKVGINTIPLTYNLEVGGSAYASTSLNSGGTIGAVGNISSSAGAVSAHTNVTAGQAVTSTTGYYLMNGSTSVRMLWYE